MRSVRLAVLLTLLAPTLAPLTAQRPAEACRLGLLTWGGDSRAHRETEVRLMAELQRLDSSLFTGMISPDDFRRVFEVGTPDYYRTPLTRGDVDAFRRLMRADLVIQVVPRAATTGVDLSALAVWAAMDTTAAAPLSASAATIDEASQALALRLLPQVRDAVARMKCARATPARTR